MFTGAEVFYSENKQKKGILSLDPAGGCGGHIHDKFLLPMNSLLASQLHQKELYVIISSALLWLFRGHCKTKKVKTVLKCSIA